MLPKGTWKAKYKIRAHILSRGIGTKSDSGEASITFAVFGQLNSFERLPQINGRKTQESKDTVRDNFKHLMRLIGNR
jgi:hypothetical protein